MSKHPMIILALTVVLPACGSEALTPEDSAQVTISDQSAAQIQSQGLTRRDIPEEDPGPPYYARVTTILNQFFHDDGWLAIPFYRDPGCVPPDFNLLQLFDAPGPDGPGAFACPLQVRGFLLIEPDAPLGTFPRQVVLRGADVPIWFVPWSGFQAEAADGVVTFAELQAMNPIVGTASRFHETLKPREGDHVVIIKAAGQLEDGRSFQFGVTHIEDRTRSVQVRFQ